MIKSHLFPKKAQTNISVFIDALKYKHDNKYYIGFNRVVVPTIPCLIKSPNNILKNIFSKQFKCGIYAWTTNHNYSAFGNCVLKGYIPKGSWYYESSLGDIIASQVKICDIYMK